MVVSSFAARADAGDGQVVPVLDSRLSGYALRANPTYGVGKVKATIANVAGTIRRSG